MSDVINKLEAGARELFTATQAQRTFVSTRAKHAKAQEARGEAFRAAADAGVSQAAIARATGLTPARVGQILAGGAR